MIARTIADDSTVARHLGTVRGLVSGREYEIWTSGYSGDVALFAVQWQRDAGNPAPAGNPRSGRDDEMHREVLRAVLWASIILIIGVTGAAVAQLVLLLLY